MCTYVNKYLKFFFYINMSQIDVCRHIEYLGDYVRFECLPIRLKSNLVFIHPEAQI